MASALASARGVGRWSTLWRPSRADPPAVARVVLVQPPLPALREWLAGSNVLAAQPCIVACEGRPAVPALPMFECVSLCPAWTRLATKHDDHAGP